MIHPAKLPEVEQTLKIFRWTVRMPVKIEGERLFAETFAVRGNSARTSALRFPLLQSVLHDFR